MHGRFMVLDVRKIHQLLLILAVVFSAGIASQETEGVAKKDELPRLSTKQAIRNLRLVSENGRFTYYQRRNGSLLLSQNYSVTEVLKGEIGTNYVLFATPARKHILIQQDLNHHDNLNLKALQKIYTVEYGKDVPTFRADGAAPKLHLGDSWLSFYHPNKKELSFQNFSSGALNFAIKLKNIKNSYFTPMVVMTDENNVAYTDLNEIGIPGLIVYNRKSNEVDIVLRGDAPDQKMEICLSETHLYVLEAGINDSTLGSKIYQYPRGNFKTPERKVIYQSQRNDIGHMVCDVDKEHLYFIKNTSSTHHSATYEAAKLKLADNTVQVLTNNQYITQIINLDGRLLVPYRGVYYVLKGESDLTLDDRLAPIPRSGERSEN